MKILVTRIIVQLSVTANTADDTWTMIAFIIESSTRIVKLLFSQYKCYTCHKLASKVSPAFLQ